MTDENNAGGESSRHPAMAKAKNPVTMIAIAVIAALVVILMAVIIVNQANDDEDLAAVMGQTLVLLQDQAYDHQAVLYKLTDEVSRQGDLIAELTEQMAATVPETEVVKEQEPDETEESDEMSYFPDSSTDSDDMLFMMMLMMMFSNIAQEDYYGPGWFDDSYEDCSCGYDSYQDPYSDYGFDIEPPYDPYYSDTEDEDYPQYGMVPDDFPGTAEDWALLEEFLESIFGMSAIG